ESGPAMADGSLIINRESEDPLAYGFVTGEYKANERIFDTQSALQTEQESFPMDEKERARALELTLGQIEKQFGKGSILRLGSKDPLVPVAVISTGSISLDAALGIGGFPRGRISEIF